MHWNLHSDTDDTVRRIPEADVASVGATRGREPRQHENVDLDQDPEDQDRVPGPELGARAASTLVSESYKLLVLGLVGVTTKGEGIRQRRLT